MLPADEPGPYVYIVCADVENWFAEMAAVSMASLRIVSPTARIIALVDCQTANLRSPALSFIKSASDTLMVVPSAGENSFVRSRNLKSNMQCLLNRRFLYLDSDTLIMRSSSAIWKLDCDVAAAPDLGPDGRPYLSDKQPSADLMTEGRRGGRPYLNAGVIYFGATDAAREVGNRYRSSWLERVGESGPAHDQGAFNCAINTTQARVVVLPGRYNAQISMNAMALHDAKIVHFYTGNFASSLETVVHFVAKRLKSDGVFDISALREAIASGNPWMRIDSFRKAMATRRYRDATRLAWKALKRRFAVARGVDHL